MITQEEYHQRRCQLAKQLPEGSVAIVASGQEAFRNGDSHYRFRQASNFYYLTGFNEPDAVLILFAGSQGESLLFNQPRQPEAEQWTGKRLGQEGACQHLNVKQAFPIDSFKTQLPELLANKTALYYEIGRNMAFDRLILQTIKELKSQVRRGIKPPEGLYDIDPLIGEMRLFKSEAEIAVMRKAAEISIAAHKRAMRACRSLENEYELEAELIYEFSRQGCPNVAYTPIVGSGENACILHYIDNNQPLKRGELVLIDSGCEFENYAADITRTFPINGTFSEPQRAIYNLVLKAQKAGIRCVKPGAAWNTIQETIVHVLTTGLCELGILVGDVDELITNGAYKPFYMHNSGHWLGLDVHDSGQYKIDNQWRTLQPGMVLTVEPGLYISANLPNVDEKWWNIGVRIEDDILVTEDGNYNLTGALPVDIAEIEALMRE
ncbi:Xaa-Pro aminopeptidase [Legionella beliardensis]|uniref:Xaa-Pro aminopeptidase n=1 Tax=Legionella beliardensis TaxID=91822 RepID=A0A378HXA9_9GAMM|nr:Xaa-Pro aminopeptidase [Legionella beliardensis]STX27519.1 Xaa-Pro aminopeptidase [Legionella beliardensis]